MRFLDDVIDVSNFVTPEIASRCRGNRKVGLGIMGLADAMFELGIKYDSDAGLAFGDRVAAVLAEEAAVASEQLASRRGSFLNWQGSLHDRRHHRPMRNAATTTIAPTGTLSILASCSGGIEPVYSLAYYRHILQGQEMLEVNQAFKRFAQEHGFWSCDLEMNLAGGMPLAKARLSMRRRGRSSSPRTTSRRKCTCECRRPSSGTWTARSRRRSTCRSRPRRATWTVFSVWPTSWAARA